jgi:hypothetical protein
MSYVPGLVVQKYEPGYGWHTIAITNQQNAVSDLKMYKDEDHMHLYRIYNEVAKRVAYQ